MGGVVKAWTRIQRTTCNSLQDWIEKPHSPDCERKVLDEPYFAGRPLPLPIISHYVNRRDDLGDGRVPGFATFGPDDDGDADEVGGLRLGIATSV